MTSWPHLLMNRDVCRDETSCFRFYRLLSFAPPSSFSLCPHFYPHSRIQPDATAPSSHGSLSPCPPTATS